MEVNQALYFYWNILNSFFPYRLSNYQTRNPPKYFSYKASLIIILCFAICEFSTLYVPVNTCIVSLYRCTYKDCICVQYRTVQVWPLSGCESCSLSVSVYLVTHCMWVVYFILYTWHLCCIITECWVYVTPKVRDITREYKMGRHASSNFVITPHKRRGPIAAEFQSPGPAAINLPTLFGSKYCQY